MGTARRSILAILVARLLTAVSVSAEILPGRHVDRSLYPKAYGVLDNEWLLYPMDTADWPVKVDRSRQLFVDDYLIAKAENIEREVHAPKKHASNPLLRPEKPWEGTGLVFQIVLRDETTKKFRMWYAAFGHYKLPSGLDTRFPTCYAESDDGLKWSRPELGLLEFNGSKANNIVIHAGNPYGLMFEPNDPDPNRRYKAVVWHEPKYVPREGYFLYTSPDGIRWTRAREAPLALSSMGYTMPQSGIGDTSVFRWDRHLGKYVGDVKFILPGRFRTRGIMESDDLIHWTRPRMTLYPDALDEADSQIYGHLGFCYESMWIGFLRMYHDKRTGWKQTTVELTASRDGGHGTRVGKREEFMPLGKPGEWDADYHDPSWDPILVGDELWIYYRSCNRDPGPKNPKVGHAIGLATLRRDGFVSLNGGEQPATVITRPLTMPGRSLFVNAEVADGGWVKVAALSEDRRPIVQHTIDECTALTKGSTRERITWRETKELPLADREHVCLMFRLKQAKLYSFWME